MCSEDPAWKWLIGRNLTMPERMSLITTIFSDHNQVDMVRNLSGSDAQDFINVIGEVCTCALSSTRTGQLTPAKTSTLCQLGIG